MDIQNSARSSDIQKSIFELWISKNQIMDIKKSNFGYPKTLLNFGYP